MTSGRGTGKPALRRTATVGTLRPVAKRKRWRPFTADHFAAYASRLVFDDGETRRPEWWQLDFVRDLFQGVDRDDRLFGQRDPTSFREAWLLVPQGNGKALALDTPIPTPDGWTEMGALQVGDDVFGEQGDVCSVTFATEVMRDRECFRVVFSDGSSVVADADHLWQVRDVYRDERCRSLDVIRTTREVAAKYRVDRPNGQRCHRYSLPSACALELPELMLPVDPYVLGAWLGDGTTSDGALTFGEDFVREEISRCGYSVGPDLARHGVGSAETRTVYGLRVMLRDLGVLGKKRIPDLYLRASRLQRLNLLQGLMDTDGTISTPQGQCSLTSVSMRLAADVLELVRSLGLKATVRERRAKIAGRDCGPAWVVQFHAYDDTPVFRMPRKFARQRTRTARRSLSETRRIVDVIPTESVPVRCIQVDSASHLYLAGDGMVATHNTSLMGELALYGADYSREPWIPIGASTRDQAKVLYTQAKGFVLRTPGMRRRFRCFDGYRVIRSLRNAGEGIVVCPWEPGSNDGIIPFPYALIDEPHRHKDMSLYRLWLAKCRKRNAQIALISTAGEPGTDFENTREQVRDRAVTRVRRRGRVRAVGPGIVMHEFKVESVKDGMNIRKVKQANPLSTITIADLREALNAPTNTDHGEWLRLTCNIATRSSFAAITDREWDDQATSERIPEGAPIDLGMDIAWKWDCTAIVPFWNRDPGFQLFGDPVIFSPPRDGSMLSPHLIEDALRMFAARYTVGRVVMDREKAAQIAAWIEEELGLEVVERGRTNEPAAADYENFMEGLRPPPDQDGTRRSATLHHTGDREFRQHVMNAVVRHLGADKKRFDRPVQNRGNKREQDRRVIDCLDAASMVLTVGMAPVAAEPTPMMLRR